MFSLPSFNKSAVQIRDVNKYSLRFLLRKWWDLAINVFFKEVQRVSEIGIEKNFVPQIAKECTLVATILLNKNMFPFVVPGQFSKQSASLHLQFERQDQKVYQFSSDSVGVSLCSVRYVSGPGQECQVRSFPYVCYILLLLLNTRSFYFRKI